MEESPLKVTIEAVDNGYILKSGDSTVVVEENDYKEKREIIPLFYHIMDMLGIRGSKHDAVRVDIRLIDQDGKEIED